MTASLRPGIRFNEGFVQLYSEFRDSERGHKLLHLSGIAKEQLDMANMTQKYFEFHTGDMSVDANANIGNNKSPNNFASESVKGVSKLNAFHLLWSRLAESFGDERASELIGKIWRGYYYFHDLTGHGITSPYCFAASTMPLVFNGRPYGQLHSLPPKRANSFMSQAIEFTMDLSQEFMGAVALGDLLVNLAMFCQNDGVDLDSDIGKSFVENQIQKFVHVVNNSFRISAQSPFTNVSLFDRPQLRALFAEYEYPWGARAVDHVEYIMKVQELFMSFMSKKDPTSNMPYRFPIATVNMTLDENKKVLDEEFKRLICTYNTEGVFNVYVTEGVGKVASCCRLLSDVRQMKERQRADVWGNGGLNIGSTRVVTINLARLAFESEGPMEFKSQLKRALTDVKDLLLTHRELLSSLVEKGYLKFFKPLDWISMDMLFSTVGLVGLYEALALFGDSYVLPQKRGVKKAEELLKYIDQVVTKMSEESGVALNVEQIPAEQAAITLASADKLFYPKSPFDVYSNQSIPLWVDVDLVTRARVDGQLTKCYSGGGISHLNVGSRLTPEQMEGVLDFAVSCGLDHLALNGVFNRCAEGHTTFGKVDVCPKCGKAIVHRVTRIVGYMTPVEDWTLLRREWEFPRRVWHDPSEAGFQEAAKEVVSMSGE